ncbi:CD44 antigen isoform X16 [Chelonia mydas]|uniref:CD44 antigen isoform X16 n=1 Tax=Chelonia mydas TaxID=8469 RepID=UPI001CA854F1|nr:CD44 antigen isoform X16 [Chelonia mydas]
MKRGHEFNGPWRLSCTLILTAVVVSPDQNRGMLPKEFNISCRYAGVFHVEKNRRYNLTRSEAVELCRALNSTLPTMEQMKKAHELGFETCRYGYIEDKIVIPRIKPYFLCAANNTGIYILTSNITDRYDTYCYNASETRDMACEPITKLNDSWHDNQSRIVIDNADGSRYADGVKQPDPTPVTDDNHVGSGSTHDGDTTNPTIIRIHTSGAPYYEDITPDALSTDYSSVSGRKEYHSTSTNDIAIPFDDKPGEDSTMMSLITDGVPGKDSDHPSKGQHPTSTTVVVSNEGSKNEDATQDPFLHNVYLGGDKDEDKYATNTTVDSVKPELFPAMERDHSSSSVTVNNEIGHNTYTSTAVVVSNEGAKNEDATQDPFLHNVYLGGDKDEDKYATNTTEDSVKPELFPAMERDHSSSSVTVNNEIEHNTYTPTAVVVSNEGAKNEDATQDPFLHNVYLGGAKDEDKYATNTTVDSVKPEVFPSMERDHSSSSVTVNNEIGRNTYTPTAVVVSNEGAKNEDLTQDPLLNGAHSGWSDKVKYSTNATRDDVLPGVIPSRGSEHSTTAVVSNGGTKHEDSTQDPLLRTVHPGWGNADKYPTNVTRDDVLHGIIPPSENDQEKESSHTAVVSSDGATHEGSTQDPLLHSVHPGWGNEDKYLTATSRDDVLPGIIPLSETEHKNESSHTAVVSNDGIKHEDSTKDPLAPSIQPGGDNEDKYPTNNPIDNLIPGVFSDIESGDGRGPASTATSFITNKHGGRRANPSGQVTSPKIDSQPRSAQVPEWLIIVASLLALTLILAVCIAVNSRRRCGQKKKLVINNGKGSVSDKKMGGLNGEASKSQEMVHLVHKEQPDNRTGPCDEFLTTDETQNQQEANMKTGM